MARSSPFARPAQLLWPALLLLGLAFVGGCDSGGGDEGGFAAEARFTNRLDERLEGRALFSAGTEDGEGGASFTIELVPRSADSAFPEGVVLARGAGGALAEGDYAFTRPGAEALPCERFAGALRIGFGDAAPALYHTTGGTLQITASAEERVAGEFAFEATLISPGGTVDAPLGVTVEGTFDAERGPTDNFPL